VANKILISDSLGRAAERAAQPVIHHPPKGFSDHFVMK
jgi:hypothetical protein